MAVSLFDMMRPRAVAAGLGAVRSTLSVRHVNAFSRSSTVAGGLVAGFLANWISQRAAQRVYAWIAANPVVSNVERRLAVLYPVILVGIVLLT